MSEQPHAACWKVIDDAMRERDEARSALAATRGERDRLRDEIALMREEVASQERAHAEQAERWRKVYERQSHDFQRDVMPWKSAALRYAAQLARLGHKVTLPDAPQRVTDS